MDVSKRTKHSNAYFFGFGENKRIVLWDTILVLSPDEITAVLGNWWYVIIAHELGHWKHMHVLKGCIIGSLLLLPTFYLLGKLRVNPSFLTDFGFKGSDSVM
jgi:STE24 endopeptidase